MPKNNNIKAKSIIRSPELDEKDLTMLRVLQENGRISDKELAEHVNLTAPGLQKRRRKLEEGGFIDRYVTLVNREALGLDLLCFTQVTLTHHYPDCVSQFCDRVKELPEVLECHHLTGEFDYLLKLVVANHQHLEQLLTQQITQIPGVDKVRTSIVLNEIKVSTALPLKS